MSVNYCVADESNYPWKSHPTLSEERKKHPLFYSPTLEAVLDPEEFERYRFTEEEAAEVKNQVFGKYDGPIVKNGEEPDVPPGGGLDLPSEPTLLEQKTDKDSDKDSDNSEESTQGVLNQGAGLWEALGARPSDPWELQAGGGRSNLPPGGGGFNHPPTCEDNNLGDKNDDLGPLEHYDSSVQ